MASVDFLTRVLPPATRPDFVVRRRLLNLLHSAVLRKLALICAPAGYGKTSLMAQFIRDVELPVCWASLDGSHRDPNKLLQDIVASVHQRFPDFDVDLESQPPEGPRSRTRWQENLPTVLNRIYTEIPEIFILILDDFHEAEANPEIIQLMDTMLTNLPENLRVFLVSRSMPPLRSVPRLRAQREVVRLSQAQLRFSPGEVQEFFSSAYNREIDDAQARALVEGTKGWISAITLVAENAEPGVPISITPEARDDLYGYLAHEVFSHQPEGLRRFLLGTCVLDQLDPEICDQLVGDREAGRWLSHLREQGLFVSQTGGPTGAIQLHRLFREFLYDLMQGEDPTALREAHSRAGRTLEVRGRTLEAIDHLMRAQDFDRAAAVLEGTAEYILQHGEWHNLAAWIDSLPQHALDEHPALLVCRASIATDTGAPDTALQLCRRAEDLFRASGDVGGTTSAMLARNVALRQKGLFDQAIDVAWTALGEVPLPGDAAASKLNAETLKHVGLTLSQKGQLDESMGPLEQALGIYEALGDTYNIAILHNVLGINRGHEARYPEALFHLERARLCWTRMKNQKALAEVLNNIGMLHYVQGDLELAEETLRKGINEARQSHKPGAHAYCLASLAEVKRDGGDLAQSLLLYDEALEEARAGEMAPLIPYLIDGMSTLYRLVGQLDKGETLARQNVHPDKKLGSVEEGLYKRSLGAVLCEKGRHAEAARLLMESSELLRATDVPQELAKAEFLLAHLAQQAGKTEACAAHLREVALLLDRVQRYTFLLAEASGKQELVQYAISQGIGEVWFYPLLQGSRQVRLILGEGAEGESRHSLSRVDGYSMGACKVVLDGNEIPKKAWKTKKAVQLLFLFAYERRELRKEEIMEALWPDCSPEKANSSFQSTVYRIRRALYKDAIVERGGQYFLNPDGLWWLDAREFAQVVHTALTSRMLDETRYQLLEEALGLYKGPFLAGFDCEWIDIVQRELHNTYLSAISLLCEYHMRGRRYEEVVRHSRLALHEEPDHEEATRYLVEASKLLGREKATGPEGVDSLPALGKLGLPARRR